MSLLVLTAVSPAALAQGAIGNTTTTPVAGVPHDYITGLNEIVNPANGALSIRIAQPVPNERGQNWPAYAFIYDSNGQFTLRPSWQIVSSNPVFDALVSLDYGFGALTPSPGAVAYGGTLLTACVQTGQTTCSTYTCLEQNGYTFTDADGGNHGLGLQVGIPQTSNTSNDCSYFSVNNFYYGGDELYKASMNPSTRTVTVVDLHGNYPVIEDANGNDRNTTGRTAPLPSAATTQPGSAIPTESFNLLNNSQDGRACQATSIPYAGGGISPAQSVTLPNGEKYSFQFDPNLALINKITYPTGATVTYTWSIIPDSEGAQYYQAVNGEGGLCSLQHDWFAITKRVVSFDGITNAEEQDFAYTTTWPNAQSYHWTAKTTTVTTKDLIRGTSFNTVYSYSPVLPPQESDKPLADLGYVPLENTIQYYDTDGSILKTTTKTWKSMSLLAAECTTLPNGQISGKFYSYLPYAPFNSLSPLNLNSKYTNLPTDVAEFDYGTVSSSCTEPTTLPIRETVTAYQSFANSPLFAYPALQDRPSSVQIYGVVAGNRALLQETDYLYDGASPAAVSPIPYGHDETNFAYGSAAPRGNPTTVTKKCFVGATNCTNSVTTYTYDTTGQVLTATDANLNTTKYSYTDNYTTDDGTPPQNTNAYVTTITKPTTNGVAHITKFQYGFEDGKLRNTTDENSLVTTYCYWTNGCSGTAFDPFVRLTGTQAPDGGTSTVTYVDAGPSPSVTTKKAINSTATLATTTVYDGMAHATQTQLTSDPQGTVYTDTKYDGLGNVYTVSNPHRTCGTDPTSSCGTTTYVYDALGRKRSATYPDSSVLTTVYCSASTLVTDPTTRWRRSRSDALGRLVEVDEPNSTTATVNSNGCPSGNDPIWVTTYTLDALGNLTNVLQNGSHGRTFTYDSLSRLLTSANPEVGTITYTYDANGNVQTKKDARAITTTYAYDALNRELSSTYSNGDPTITTTYDQSACLVLTACQNIGHRTSMTDAAGSEAWSYQIDKTNSRSAHADQRTITSSPSNITKTATYYLDLVGNVTQEVYPTSRTVNYTYDAADRPSTAVDSANGITYATGWQTGSPAGCVATATCYTPQGSIYGFSVGQTSSFTGLNITNTYSYRLQPQEFKASSPAGSAIDITYSFVDAVKGGNAGHVASVTNNLNSSRTQSFTYDQVNRIISAGTSATTGTYCWGYQFSYDGAWGNLTSQAGWTPTYSACTQTNMATVTADGNNHISAFGYDASGNASGDGSYTYAWDGESQLKSAGGVSYLYDGDGRRAAKVGSKLYWYGARSDILAETNPAGATTNEYIFFGGRRIALLPASATAQYFAEDSLGSSRIVTTNSGTVCYDADFTPYGGERPYTNSCPQNYKFEGKERDTETTNDYFGARYYSNRFGRWLSADWSAVPVAIPYAILANPQTLNLYAMVDDDPETSADLNGHCANSPAPCAPAPENCVGQACHGEQPNENKDFTPHANLCVNSRCALTSGGAAHAIHVFEHLVGDAIKGVVGELEFGVGVIGAEITITLGELSIFAPSTSSTDTWPNVAKSKTDTRLTKPEKNTLEGAEDQRESITKEQAKLRRWKQGEKIKDTRKSQDREKHQHDDIVSGKAGRPDRPEPEK